MRLRYCAEPAALCRMTSMSALSAWMFCAVSRSVSPLTRLDEVPEMEITSALRRDAAISNATRVRVLGSRKRLTMVRPRSEGTFFCVRSERGLELLGGGENAIKFLARQVLDAEEVLARPVGGGGRGGGSAHGAGGKNCSRRRLE